MKTLTKCFLVIFLYAIAAYSCQTDSIVVLPNGDFRFSLSSDADIAEDSKATIIIFDATDSMVQSISYKYEDSYSCELAVSSGVYTFVALIGNESISFTDEPIRLSELLEELKNSDTLLHCGVSVADISSTGIVNNIDIFIEDEVSKLDFPSVALSIATPSSIMSDYNSSSRSALTYAEESAKLRMTIEMQRGASIVFRKSYFVEESIFERELFAREGDYNIVVWADYAFSLSDDLHYNTAQFNKIETLSANQYIANSQDKDAFAAYVTTSVSTKGSYIDPIEMYRPLAKYSIVTNDIEKYNQERAKSGYAELTDLSIEVYYTGYLPTAYNIYSGRLTNAQLGYKYNASIGDITEKTAVIATDFVFVANGASSSVTIAVIVKDANGGIINEFGNINVAYGSGYHTTITGSFLTENNGGFELDQEWDGSFNVEF